MAAHMIKAWTVTMLLAATFRADGALAQSPTLQPTTTIAPIRPEFTRPGGMPGAPRAGTAAPERYMRAVPSEPPQPVRKKRRRRR